MKIMLLQNILFIYFVMFTIINQFSHIILLQRKFDTTLMPYTTLSVYFLFPMLVNCTIL